jgi:hypothetical protein
MPQVLNIKQTVRILLAVIFSRELLLCSFLHVCVHVNIYVLTLPA